MQKITFSNNDMSEQFLIVLYYSINHVLLLGVKTLIYQILDVYNIQICKKLEIILPCVIHSKITSQNTNIVDKNSQPAEVTIG